MHKFHELASKVVSLCEIYQMAQAQDLQEHIAKGEEEQRAKSVVEVKKWNEIFKAWLKRSRNGDFSIRGTYEGVRWQLIVRDRHDRDRGGCFHLPSKPKTSFMIYWFHTKWRLNEYRDAFEMGVDTLGLQNYIDGSVFVRPSEIEGLIVASQKEIKWKQDAGSGVIKYLKNFSGFDRRLVLQMDIKQS